MLSITLAQDLKQQGLLWEPAENDCFFIPNRDLEDQVFVLTKLMSFLGVLHGEPVVTFHGTAEWALDSIATGEVIWLPREDQVRKALAQRLPGKPEKALQLRLTAVGYQCKIFYEGVYREFESANAEDAYALALLHVLKTKRNRICNGRKAA